MTKTEAAKALFDYLTDATWYQVSLPDGEIVIVIGSCFHDWNEDDPESVVFDFTYQGEEYCTSDLYLTIGDFLTATLNGSKNVEIEKDGEKYEIIPLFSQERTGEIYERHFIKGYYTETFFNHLYYNLRDFDE